MAMKNRAYVVLLMFLASCVVGCGKGKQGSITISSDWVVSDLTFDRVLFSGSQPTAKTAYILEATTPLVRVLCTIEDGSYIVQGGAATYVLCSDFAYVDGQEVGCGLYAYVGIRQVTVASMIKTVHAFAQVKKTQAHQYIKAKYEEIERRRIETGKILLEEEAKEAELRHEQEKARITHERELMEIKARKTKADAEREAQLDAERRKLEEERRKQAEKQAEEQRIRDQQTYAEAAAKAFSSIKFDYKEYVVIDREIEKVAQSITIDDPLWGKLRSAVDSKDYLLALGLLGSGDRLSEYPDPSETKRLIGRFFKRTFRLRLKFKNKKTSESFSRMVKAFGYWCDYRDNCVTQSGFYEIDAGDELERVYEFAIDARINYLILGKNYTNDGWSAYSQNAYNIKYDTRIDSTEKARRISRATERFLKSIHACAKQPMSKYQVLIVTRDLPFISNSNEP